MSLPRTATREEWTEARKALWEKEREFTHQRDELNTQRRELPMVEVTDDYVFDGPEGEARLIDMFDGRRQLIVYHFMFHPEWDEGCPSCTAGTDEINDGFVEHLNTRDTSYALVSRAPLHKLQAWKSKRGWNLPWYSSGKSEFNYDFGVTIDRSRGFDQYNYRPAPDGDEPYDLPGRSCFLQVDGRVFHTYSVYARGLESTGGSYYFLDLTALGRQEDWEEPKGRTEWARSNHPDFAS